jgi:hypothetical protein
MYFKYLGHCLPPDSLAAGRRGLELTSGVSEANSGAISWIRSELPSLLTYYISQRLVDPILPARSNLAVQRT